MAPIDMKRYDISMYEIPPAPYTQPSERTLQQHTGSLPRYHSTDLRPSVISSDQQTFPILPGQLEKHLEQARQRIAYDIPVQATPACGSAPSLSSERILVLNPPSGMVSTVYAFHASTLGMPSTVEYLRLLTRYLDEMSPNKRGKALIDSELLRRIKLILTPQHEGFPSSGGTSSESYSALSAPGGSWDTPAFRRWVRNSFAYRPATRAELERAIDFGLLSPPESSLSGPGIPGYPPSTGFVRAMNLVFHRDRPVALRSRIYKIILRAHWITNHAGRDRTWAMVREVCSHIPKCLVYEFVAACPACRVARSRQYGMSAAEKHRETLQHRFLNKDDKGNSNTEGRLPPILLASSHDTPPEGWIPRPNDPPHTYPTQIPAHPSFFLNRHELHAQIVADPTSNLPFDPIRLLPLPTPLPPVTQILPQAIDRSQQSNSRSQDLWENQQEASALERGQYPSWTLISKLIEMGGDHAEDMGVLEGSPALKRKDGPSAPEESIKSAGANFGHQAMAFIPSSEAHRSDEDTSMETD